MEEWRGGNNRGVERKTRVAKEMRGKFWEGYHPRRERRTLGEKQVGNNQGRVG